MTKSLTALVLILLFFGTGSELWIQHQDIVGLQSEVVSLSVQQNALIHQGNKLNRNQKVLGESQKVLNSHQQTLIEVINEILKEMDIPVAPDTKDHT